MTANYILKVFFSELTFVDTAQNAVYKTYVPEWFFAEDKVTVYTIYGKKSILLSALSANKK